MEGCWLGTPILLQGRAAMKWRAQSNNLKPKRFEIEHDPVIGFYLYIFEGENCIGDYLQDTFEVAIESALEDYDVLKDEWKEVED
jgi:hypothetical protein